MARKKPMCFVIMPFGVKKVGDLEIDFDMIWTDFISRAGETSGFELTRADQRMENGIITSSMIRDIYHADVAIADVTYHNPNVFYELGVRHALARHGTVLIKWTGGDKGVRVTRDDAPFVAPRPLINSKKARERAEAEARARRKAAFDKAVAAATKAVDIPFDLKDVVHLHYEFAAEKMEDNLAKLAGFLAARHNAIISDSPVYTYLPTLRVQTPPAPSKGRYDRTYEIADAPGKFVGYRSGDVNNLDGKESVDFWVNSENTLMQMARVFEKSMSSTIRYLGAMDPASKDGDLDPKSPTFDDVIQKELSAKLGNRYAANEGEIIVTGSGRLKTTHGVRAILHAAAVTGQPRKGFRSIGDDDLVECVRNVVRTVRKLLREGGPEMAGAHSVIMPLFGTGQAGRDPVMIAGRLIQAAIDELSVPAPDLGDRDINLVLFSAFSEADVDLMRRQLRGFEADGTVTLSTKSEAEAGVDATVKGPRG